MEREPQVSFEDTELAFAYKSDRELRMAGWMFRLMSREFWSEVMITLGSWALRWRVPLVEFMIRRTVYRQFIGGATLQDCVPVIRKLDEYSCLVVLDYAVEGKHEESELDEACDQFIRTIEFAASQSSVPVITLKLSALAQNDTLQAWSETGLKPPDFEAKWDRIVRRLGAVCDQATEYGIKVFIDAEDSWIQDAIDHLADLMMKTYNREEVYIYNTYQMYRHDRLEFLKNSYARARQEGYMLGAKLVRGAYMEKERERAQELNYPSPISVDKKTVDRDYNEAILYCAEKYEHVAMCAATHNLISCRLLADFIAGLPVRKDHPHLNFCQLYGMGDDITFNLADQGYNVAKYLPYGPVREAFPYLVRRAEENKAMSNEFNREYLLIQAEQKRRREV